MARSNESIEDDLILCGLMVRSLAHAVRGDLAVIQNDLTYLSTIVPPDEIERPKNRCARASETLRKLLILSDSSSKSECSCEEIGGCFSVENAENLTKSRVVKINRGVLRGWIAILHELLGRWRATAACGDGDVDQLVIRLWSEPLLSTSAYYKSWHAFAAAELGERSVLDGCVADLAMRSFGWSVELRHDEYQRVAIVRIPISKEVEPCER